MDTHIPIMKHNKSSFPVYEWIQVPVMDEYTHIVESDKDTFIGYWPYSLAHTRYGPLFQRGKEMRCVIDVSEGGVLVRGVVKKNKRNVGALFDLCQQEIMGTLTKNKPKNIFVVELVRYLPIPPPLMIHFIEDELRTKYNKLLIHVNTCADCMIEFYWHK
ncbi:MAG: hypothetical protein V3T88_00970 [Nitrosomonadaceae bacterium]